MHRRVVKRIFGVGFVRLDPSLPCFARLLVDVRHFIPSIRWARSSSSLLGVLM